MYTLQPVVWKQLVVQPVTWTMQMSAAKRRLSGPARTLMTSLGWRAQQGGCVDSRRCGAFDRISFKKFRFLKFIFTLSSIWSREKRTIGSITKIHKTLLNSIYLFIILLLQPVVEPAAKCKRTFSVCFRDLQCPDFETSHTTGSTVFLYTLYGTL